jgi:hypothetical protein
MYSISALSDGGVLYFAGQLCTFLVLWLRAKFISLSSAAAQWVLSCLVLLTRVRKRFEMLMRKAQFLHNAKARDE